MANLAVRIPSSLEAAARDYGVAIRCSRRPDEQVSMPEHFSVDAAATATLRSAKGGSQLA